MSDVVFAVDGTLGRITLNRPQALNALTFAMTREIAAQLAAWQTDPAVKLVLLAGAGERGLCAGGDIRQIYHSARAGTNEGAEFFRAEYPLNAQIAEYPKPIVALMDGIVMGGGIGLSAHASHRVVTERSQLAMPEVGIGFFPDIGATYLLSRPELGELGTHIALATARLAADDAIMAGLADQFIPADRLHQIPGALRECTNAAEIDQALSRLASAPERGKLREAAGWIDECYTGDDVETIVARLEARPEQEARAAAREILTKSPISLKQTLRMLRHARGLLLRPCLEIEFRTAVQFIAQPDFIEGVRAAVIDKDRNPRWSIPHLSDVTDAMLDRLFPAFVEGWQPLFAPTE